MMTRRDFLHGAVATTGLALGGPVLASWAGAAGPLPDASMPRLDAALYQPELPASAAFGAAARRRGVAAHAFDGDISRLWIEGVLDAWWARPTVIAGLTTYPALFLLERIGWDHGMRVISRGEPVSSGGEQLHPWVIAPRISNLARNPR
ncbi:MAG: hypothetical protein ABS92_01830 [Thiobacillus sp. SCN 63-374]|nr:MAG: hypothetical protein ABS92_01830 [Thiobacillus sp. SCN 63-374]